jgi:hypothetical protein
MKPHPRAYASVPHLNPGSPAIPAHFDSSLQASKAHKGRVTVMNEE